MKTLLLVFVFITFSTVPIINARAGLQVSAGSAAGTPCFSECTNASGGCPLVQYCECGDNCPTETFSCPSSYNSTMRCYLGKSGNRAYYCNTGENACMTCGSYSGASITSGWTTVSTGKVSRTTITLQSSGYDECVQSSSTTEYGCASGYYTTGSRSASMTCTICPANATCGSTGNAEVFKCNDGYYRNGSATTCTQCPSSGGITAKTGKTGATAITECYIPSGSSFSDSKGSGTYTDNCYYTN